MLYLLYFGGLAALYVRFGLLCAAVALFASQLPAAVPYAIGFSWYSQAGNTVLFVVFLLAALGFYTSTLAGRIPTSAKA